MAATMSSPLRTAQRGRAYAPRAALRPAQVGGVLVDPSDFIGNPPPDERSRKNLAPLGGRLGHPGHPGHPVGRGSRRAPIRSTGLIAGGLRTMGVRSVLVAAAMALVVVAALVGNEVASAGPGAAPTLGVRSVHVVVQPGDSIWVIARRVQPTGDVRPLVQAIIDAHGTAAVSAGDTLLVPLP